MAIKIAGTTVINDSRAIENLATPLSIAQGGTSANTSQLAINALAGAVTNTQYLRGNGTNVVMSAIQAGDVPTLNQNTTGSADTFTSTSQNSQFNSVGVGTAASATTGEIRATNNVTAFYSDKRLKTNIVPIPNALYKVSKISGVPYRSNEVAYKYGYVDPKLQVGVIAQEVEKVLPEIVVPAPFDIGQNEDGTEYSLSGENYLTVRYDRLVPLLIEAIKELKTELDELKNIRGNDNAI